VQLRYDGYEYGVAKSLVGKFKECYLSYFGLLSRVVPQISRFKLSGIV
jgi:hypothetical protein